MKDLAGAKAGRVEFRGGGRAPGGGPRCLLSECELQFPGPRTAHSPIVNFHPQRATAVGHVIRANMAAAAAGS